MKLRRGEKKLSIIKNKEKKVELSGETEEKKPYQTAEAEIQLQFEHEHATLEGNAVQIQNEEKDEK